MGKTIDVKNITLQIKKNIKNMFFHVYKQEAQLLLGDRATRKHAKDS